MNIVFQIWEFESAVHHSTCVNLRYLNGIILRLA